MIETGKTPGRSRRVARTCGIVALLFAASLFLPTRWTPAQAEVGSPTQVTQANNASIVYDWMIAKITYATLQRLFTGTPPTLADLKRRQAIFEEVDPGSSPPHIATQALAASAYSLASSTPFLPFLGNQMVVADPLNAAGTLISAVGLRRLPDCSLNEVVVEPVNNLPDPSSVLELTGAQNYFHRLSGLATTANAFPQGCYDSPFGKRSSTTALPIGITANNLSLVAALDASTGRLTVRAINSVTLASTVTTLTTTAATSLTVADVDGDGLYDILVAGVGSSGTSSGSVMVFHNNGDGTFRSTATIPSGAVFFVVDDVNGDGKPDIVSAGGYDTSGNALPGVTTLLGNGDGTFRPAVVSAATVTAVGGSLLTGDFNGDGKTDLLFGTQVVFGVGDGTFTAGPSLPAAVVNEISGNAAVGDLNRDGKTDLAYTSIGGAVQVLLGNGDGSFTFGLRYASLSPSQAVVVTDIDGDGNPDLVVGNGSQGIYIGDSDDPLAQQFQILPGRGDGSFVAAPVLEGSYTGNSSAPQLATGDFNADGKLDVAVISLGTPNQIVVLPGDGLAGFGTSVRTSVNLAPSMLVAKDMNGDGKPDVVIAGASTTGAAPVLAVLTNQGNGGFGSERDYALPNAAASLAVGDFNGDGFMDVAVGVAPIYGGPGTAGVYVLFGQSNGTLGSPVPIDASLAPVSLAAGDLDGDGRTDLVVADRGSSSANGALHVYLGKADGSFATAAVPTTAATRYTVVALGDINGDGKQDLVVAGSVPGASFGVIVANVYTFLGNGNGSFQAATTQALAGSDGNGANAIALGDFNNDGHLDVALTNQADFTEILIGKGDGTYLSTVMPLAQGSQSLVAGDLDNDRFPELLVGASGIGTTVFRNAGTAAAWTGAAATTTPATGTFAVSATPSSATIAAGQSVQTIVAVMPAGGFTGSVALSCSAGLPAGASCTFNPASVAVTGTAAVSSSLTIKTAASAVALLDGRGGLPGGLVIFAMGGTGLWMRRRRPRIGTALSLLCVTMLLGSCGGDDGNGNSNSLVAPMTQTTYNIVITATSGATSQTATYALTIR